MKIQSTIVKGLCAAGCCILSMAGSARAQYYQFNTYIPQYPGGGDGIPLTTGGELVANGGDVTVTYLGWGGAAYTEYLFLATPGSPFSGVPGPATLPTDQTADPYNLPLLAPTDPNYGGMYLINNQSSPAGAFVDLGSFAAGTEVEFGIWVVDTGNTWYDGPGSRNADGDVHAYIVNDFQYSVGYVDPTGTYVGFEDLDNQTGADDNYSDLQFVFNGVTGSVPDASTTASLLVLSLGGLMGMAPRFKKQG